MGYSLLVTGNFAQSLKHYDSAIALYDPAVHRPRAMLFLGGDPRVVNLSSRSLTLWFLGYAEAALADTNHCLKDARDINQAGSLFYALNHATITHFLCGQYTNAESLANELCTLADEKGASMVWKSPGLLFRGWILAVVSRATEAVQLITSGLAALPAGATLLTPVGLSLLAKSQHL